MADSPAPQGGGLSFLGGLSRRRRDDLLLALAGALLFLPGIGGRDLWNPDEPRYAEVVREMRLRGDYLVPHLNGEIYAHKPPLQFWAIAAAALVRGRLDESAVRLPAVASAVAALLLVSRLGERLFNRRSAWIAAAAFATCAKILWQGRIGQIDMLLTALVAAAVWFWVRSWTEERPSLALLFFFFTGLATLAKGPVGLLPPLLGILAFLALRRDGQGLRRLRLGRGLLLWAAVVLAWLIPAGLHAGRDYVEQIVLRQNVTRYADPWHHYRPWYYYLTVLPGDFFPWSLLLPGALVAGWKGLALRHRQGFLFCLCWAVATLAFFSLSPAKRTVYILTMYPALALALGAGLDHISVQWPRRRWWVLGPLAGMALLLGAAAAVATRAVARRVELAELGPGLGMEVAVLAAALALAAAAALWLGRRGRVAGMAAALAGGMAVAAIAAVVRVLPRFDVIKSARPMSQRLGTLLAAGDLYGIYPRLDSGFLFYGGRFATELTTEAELREFVAAPGRRFVLAQRDDLARIGGPPLRLRELARDADLREGYLLLVKEPGGDGPAYTPASSHPP